MKIRTDVTTLSKLYPIFEDAGISGILTGDFDTIKDLSYSSLCGALLSGGRISEVCQIITGSEVYTVESEDPAAVPMNKVWAECTREECMGVIVPFLIDISVGPLPSDQITKTLTPQTLEQS